MTEKINLKFIKGDTFIRVFRWATTPLVYKSISGISNSAPVRITATSHGITEGWKVAVIDVLGMTQINSKYKPPKVTDFKKATVVDSNTIEINEISSASYSTYTSGGSLVYYTPVDLTGFTAFMEIKDRDTADVLVTYTGSPNLVIDNSAKTITLTISPADTNLVTWEKADYDLQLTGPTGDVTTLVNGTIRLLKQITID